MSSILVIDDDKATRNLIAHLLKPTGLEIIPAENGIEGVRKALVHHPDVITVDVIMPRLNGLNMMRIISLLRLQIPAIFVTVKSDIGKFVRFFPSVENICLKDRVREELLTIVNQVLSNPHRKYNDVEYTLSEKEMFGLLGKSDRKKLLVATDSLTMELIETSLQDSELYEIYYAPDGPEAIFKAVMIKPDLILCDTEIPEIDGIMLARILYILGHPFPLAFLSDKQDLKTVKKASKLEGIQDYLLKNEIRKDKDLLPARIEKIVNISAQDREALQVSYRSIDIEKIEDFSMESSIWASLAP